jgi:O-methyltransferase involved in polyketide biosynthesis
VTTCPLRKRFLPSRSAGARGAVWPPHTFFRLRSMTPRKPARVLQTEARSPERAGGKQSWWTSKKSAWYDIDLPDVIALRRRLCPQRAGLHTIAASVTDPGLLDTIPAALRVLVVAEGLTPYLRTADGVAMLARIVEHLPSGEMIIDGYSRAGLWLLRRYPPVKASGAQLDWSIGDPRELEKAVPGLVFDCEWWSAGADDIKRHYPPLFW